MLNKQILLVAGFAAFFAGISTAMAADATHFLADRHIERKVPCQSCHIGNNTEKPVRKEACLTCHGSYAKLAERTAKVEPNPHFNHFGDRDCSTCHKGHTPSVLSCAQCHKFDLKTP